MGRLTGKKILMVVGEKNYNEQEYEHLHELFLEEGAVVAIASQGTGKALGRLGGYVVPQLSIAEAKSQDYDAIVLIGGYGAYAFLWDNIQLHELLREAQQLNKLLVAASVSAVTLANAGLLQGKNATVYPDYNAAVILSEKGANHVYQSVVVDDNIITSNHPRKVKQLGETIVTILSD
jgi:protease I